MKTRLIPDAPPDAPYREEKYQRLIVRMEPEDLQKVKAAAASAKMPMAEFVRVCVAERLAAYSEQSEAGALA